MQDVRITLRNLAAEATALHAKERGIVFESILLVGKLDAMNAPANLAMSTEQFAETIGLTIDQWYKRCRASRTFRYFPQTKEMVETGELKASHVEMIYGKITQANQRVLLEGIKGKSRKDIEAFLRRVTSRGEMLPEEAVEVEVTLKLTVEEIALIQRAREVQAAAGHVPTTKDVVVKALKDHLERRDPMKKAERALAREEKKAKAGVGAAARQAALTTAIRAAQQTPAAADAQAIPAAALSPVPQKPAAAAAPQTPESAAAPQTPTAARQTPASPARTARSRYVPAAVRHAVYRRDEGQCTFTHADGSRCGERAMVELDHYRRLFCRGGGHTVDDLTLRCRYHNQAAAAEILGHDFMAKRRGS